MTGVLLYLAIHRIRTKEFEVEGDIMMIVAALAVVFNIVLGLLLHGVCKMPHSHSHSHSHAHLQDESESDSDSGGESQQVEAQLFFTDASRNLSQFIVAFKGSTSAY